MPDSLIGVHPKDSDGDFDLRVESRFKNAVLWRAVLDKCSGMLITKHTHGLGALVAREAGVPVQTYYAYLNLRQNPYYKSGSLAPNARKLADYLNVPALQLFPPSLYDLKFPRVIVREYRSVQILQLLPSSGAITPDYDTAIDRSRLIDDALHSLSPREEKFLRRRFRDDWSFREIANEEGVTTERIRQITAKAIRKLRHPSRSYPLRDLL